MSGTDQTVSGSGETYEALRDDRNALRRLLTVSEARIAAQWPVVEAAISFAGVDMAFMKDPQNPMLRTNWHAAMARIHAAVEAYQEAQQ